MADAADDLWQMPLTTLDKLAVSVNARVNAASDTFLASVTANVTREAREKAADKLRLEILLYIMGTMEEEAAKAKVRRANRESRQFLESLLERRKIATLESLSEQEIQAQLDAVGADEEEG